MTHRRKKSISGFLLHIHPPRIPFNSARLQYTWGLGGAAVFFFLITFISGLALLVYYLPESHQVNQSLQKINSVYEFGWFIRSVHYWSGNLMVVFTVLHLLRIVLTGSYLRGREINWIIGMGLLVFTIFGDFTGYLLRWDSIYYDALLVSTNLLKAIPGIGQSLYLFILGGSEIGNHTLIRLYFLHIFLIPVLLFLLMIYHFWRIRKDGGISVVEKIPDRGKIQREDLFEKEKVMMGFLLAFLLIISIFFPPNLGSDPVHTMGRDHTQAPWIFAWVQLMLRAFPPFFAGILIPGLIFIYFAILPYVDKNHDCIGVWFSPKRQLYWISSFLIFFLILLMVILEFRFFS